MPKVLLFGTSGNPPTGRNGHSGIVQYFVGLGEYDELWVLPVYQHMFMQKREVMANLGSPTYEDRIEMCRLSFEWLSSIPCKVKVKRTEQEVYQEILKAREAGDPDAPARSSTYDVVKYLQERHPDTEFSLLLGTDTYQDVVKGKWRKANELKEIISLVVVDRLGVRPETENLLVGVDVHHPPMLSNVSSTEIRNATAAQLMSRCYEIEEPVLESMRARRLYGFGRQSRLQRFKMAASERLSVRSVVLAAAASLLVTVPIFVAAAARHRRGQGRSR